MEQVAKVRAGGVAGFAGHVRDHGAVPIGHIQNLAPGSAAGLPKVNEDISAGEDITASFRRVVTLDRQAQFLRDALIEDNSH